MLKLTPEAKAGVTVLISVVLLTTMVMAVGRIDIGRRDAIEVNILYNTVDGLREGAPVRYAGVNVGTVAAIQIASDGVLVKVQFDRELLIPADSLFAIKNVGILGDKYIEVQPGTAQQPLDITKTIVGKEPVVIDSILVGVESTLYNLNQAIEDITEVVGSDELQKDVIEAGKLLKETVAGLKITVDQVSQVAVSVQGVVENIGSISNQFPDLELKDTFDDIQKFASELGNLNLQDPMNEINQFAAQLNNIPISELTDDVRKITQGLSEIDFNMVKDDIHKFTNMLSAADIQPLITEIMVVTEQIKALDLAQRGDEIAKFTAQLGAVPLAEITADLQTVAKNLSQVPIGAIADNIYALSDELSAMPITEIVDDLKVVTKELKDFGWNELSEQIAAFTNELSSFDIQELLAGVTDDLNTFSSSLASIELDELLAGVSKTVDNLENLTAIVDPESIDNIMCDLEGITRNVNIASREINDMVSVLNQDVSKFSQETFVAVEDIKKIVSGVEQAISSINLFIDDMVVEGDTADNFKSTLVNVQDGTKELVELLELVTRNVKSETGPIAELQTALNSIQKLNADIENIRTMGEKVEVKSTWGAQLKYKSEEDDDKTRLMANIGFEFWPHDSKSFLLIGMRDILGKNNHLQLQYGRQSGIFRQRYGIVDTSLGLGLDSQVSDKLGLTAELTRLTTHRPTLSLRGNYAWSPDWAIDVSLDEFLSFDGPKFDGFSIGIERRF